MKDAESKGSKTFIDVIYPCCRCKFIRRFLNISHSKPRIKDVEDNPSQEPRCSKMIDAVCFHPEMSPDSRSLVLSPETYSLPFEIVNIQTRDGLNLMGYLILQVEHKIIPTIIHYHGNSGNIGDRLRCCQKMHSWMKFNILLVEYRGYGFSEGRPSEAGVYLDAQAAFDYAYHRPDLDSKQLVVYGASLGGAVAIDLATRESYKHRIAVLVLENTFYSLKKLARHVLPKCFLPLVHILPLSNKFPSSRKISLVVCPTLFISGQIDKVVPPYHMTKLYTECTAVKKIHRFEKGDHNNPWLLDGFTELYTEFVLDAIQKYPVA